MDLTQVQDAMDASLASTIITNTNPIITTSPYTTIGNGLYSNLSYSDYYNKTEEITQKIPTIFTIKSVLHKNPYKILIEYTTAGQSRVCPLDDVGSLYFAKGEVYGAYSQKENYYWKNQLIVEFESKENSKLIIPGDRFVNATQWDKQISIPELIALLNDDELYYQFIHQKAEEFLKDVTRDAKIKQHRELDKIYNFE